MKLLLQIDRATAAALKWITLASLVLLFCTVTMVVVTRVFELRSAGWTDELIELFFAWLLFPCAAALWRSKGHFAVDLLPQTLSSAALKRVLAILVEVLCLGFLAVLFWQACVFVESTLSETSPVFGVSRIYWYGVMPLTAAIMIVYSAARLAGLLLNKEISFQ
jgi:TRAP-type C4-dicarboxylate transport system permease small subunit